MKVRRIYIAFFCLGLVMNAFVANGQTEDFDAFGTTSSAKIIAASLGVSNPFIINHLGGTAKFNFILGEKVCLGGQFTFTQNAMASESGVNASSGYAGYNQSALPGSYCLIASGNLTYYFLGDNSESKKGLYGIIGFGYSNLRASFNETSPAGTASNQWAYSYNASNLNSYFSGNIGVGADRKVWNGRIFIEAQAMAGFFGVQNKDISSPSGSAVGGSEKYKINLVDFSHYGALTFSVGYTYYY